MCASPVSEAAVQGQSSLPLYIHINAIDYEFIIIFYSCVPHLSVRRLYRASPLCPATAMSMPLLLTATCMTGQFAAMYCCGNTCNTSMKQSGSRHVEKGTGHVKGAEGTEKGLKACRKGR